MKQISQSSLVETSIELDALPPPSASSTPKRRSTNDTSHSLLSKTLFSLCFSESCTLFLLLMCQALDVFNIRCVEFFSPHVHSQAYAALVSLIGKYPSMLSRSISLFSYHCRYVWSLLLRRIHVSHISVYILSGIIPTFCIRSPRPSRRARHLGPTLCIFLSIVLRPTTGWYCLLRDEQYLHPGNSPLQRSWHLYPRQPFWVWLSDYRMGLFPPSLR